MAIKYVVGDEYQNKAGKLVCVFTNEEYTLFEDGAHTPLIYYNKRWNKGWDDQPTPIPKIEVRTLTMFKIKGPVPTGRSIFGLGEVDVIKADEWVDKLGDVELTFVDNNLTEVRLV